MVELQLPGSEALVLHNVPVLSILTPVPKADAGSCFTVIAAYLLESGPRPQSVFVLMVIVDSAKSIHCSVCVLQMTRHDVSFSFFLVYKQFDARCCVVNLQINQ